jgi:hypothetical protein
MTLSGPKSLSACRSEAMKQPSASTDCHLLPEMVDDAMGQLASQGGDVRAAVAEARRVAELMRGQDSTREQARPQGPA